MLQKVTNMNPIRIMALVKNELSKDVSILNNVMSTQYPSIWLHLFKNNWKGLIVSGVYREWTHNEIKSTEEQMKNMEILTVQIEQVSEISQEVIILGDVNLDASKWNELKYDQEYDQLRNKKNTLSRCGLEIMDLEHTFMSDSANKDGKVAESSLDPIYASERVVRILNSKVLEKTSTDHLPIIANIWMKKAKGEKFKSITKIYIYIYIYFF